MPILNRERYIYTKIMLTVNSDGSFGFKCTNIKIADVLYD